MNDFYQPRPIKRQRRTRAAIEDLRTALYGVLEEDNPMSVRQVFYRMVSLGLIQKTEADYKNVVGRQLVLMRREGVVPYHWIADNTRWMRKPTTWSSLGEMLDDTQRTYRRDLWRNQGVYLEVWCESDSVAGILVDVTAKWDVPLMVCRGFASETFLYESIQSIAQQKKPAHLFYYGDLDPSGLWIPRKIQERIEQDAPGADITFTRVAVNENQIEDMNLVTRPPKPKDSRARNFRGGTVEIEAIPARTLRQMCEDCITRHVDPQAYAVCLEAERSERETMRTLIGIVEGAA